nr:flagellar assembly peptidoglycan hydrolase FlgJ [Luteimonas cucumeris]
MQPTLSLGGTQAPDAARIQEVSRQLEGQFAQMLIKCMRDASFGDSLFPGENQMFRDMYDQQLAKAMTQGDGLGLAPMIARQLGGATPTPSKATAAMGLSEYRRLMPGGETAQMLDAISGRDAAGTASAGDSDLSASLMSPLLRQLHAAATPSEACAQVEAMAAVDPDDYAPGSRENFVAQIWPHAQDAAKELGVDPRALVAQAALETGWGRRGIQRDDGGSSHNLFGIKATGWSGERVRTGTHEYRDGVRQNESADFRAYGSPAESFADYVRLLKNSPRYQQALAAGTDIHGFAKGLQRAGYATDPSYASKIASIATGPTLDKVLSAIGSAATTVASTALRHLPLPR